jgi:mono/diheme cytochrome c family protein
VSVALGNKKAPKAATESTEFVGCVRDVAGGLEQLDVRRYATPVQVGDLSEAELWMSSRIRSQLLRCCIVLSRTKPLEHRFLFYHLLALATVLAASVPLLAQDGQAPVESARAQELFITNCATCHGATGDGKGVTQLDRPARSFKDGGFSFGNTPEALFRTISTGIPGTPMPGFDAAMTAAERRAVALYVRTLGPPIEELETSAAVLEVKQTALVVRGHLPPIEAGAKAHARGLLIGTTSGLTFEYRVDDVRLLGVRQGAFVERTDWVGRGGSALKPLGHVFFSVAAGNPEAVFQLDGVALGAKLRSTLVDARTAGLSYDLLRADGTLLASIDESVRAVSSSKASGFERTFRLSAKSSWPQAEVLSARLIAPIGPARDGGEAGVTLYADGQRVQAVLTSEALPVTPAGLQLALERGQTLDFTVTTILAPDWSEETRKAVLEELR